MFVDGAHEGAWARRFRDLVALHEEDIGGRASLSQAQISLCRRIATLEVELENMEGKLSKGEEVNLDVYQRSANTLRRLITTIGLTRAMKTINPIADHFSRPVVRA